MVQHTPPAPNPDSVGVSTLTGNDSGFESSRLQELTAGAGPSMHRIGWRRRVLLLVAVLACLSVFLTARHMAQQRVVDAEWRTLVNGHLELVSSRDLPLRGRSGTELLGLINPAGELVAVKAPATATLRWWADDEERDRLTRMRLRVAEALESGDVTLVFSDGSRVEVRSRSRGYGGLGAMFWVMSTFATVLFLVGWVVPLVQPRACNTLYAVMAQAQAIQLLLGAVSAVGGMSLPAGLISHEGDIRTFVDLVTGAAVVHAVAVHPARLPWRRLIALLAWGLTLAYSLLNISGQLDNRWAWGQALILFHGILCIIVLSTSNRLRPHPFSVITRRFALIMVSTLALLTLAVSLRPVMSIEVQPTLAVAPVIWSVFLASVILLVPFISRSQSVMREFAMLAGISTLATSADLLFVAAFSFSQFASLTLSLFIALGAYAAIRQWLVTQMMGARALTTERMFEHLYRIAREVEARPERAADRMIELLRNVFEPLETLRIEGRAKVSRMGGNGAVLLVPLPDLRNGPGVDGVLVLRFAERGTRLFTPDDARLADRVLEQLKRALAHDRAVERGRSEERARIAQDLHDDIGARLLTLMYKAPSQEMEDYVRHTLQDLKTLTRGLAAKSHSLALAAAEWKTDISHRLEAIGCDLEWTGSFDEDITLSMVQWSSLTRIVRELVSNVISHSRARHVHIECQLVRGQFTLILSDDGIGRHPAKWSHGLGLGGIRKRVKLMGGTVQWREREPAGIVCTVQVPRLSETSGI